VTPLGRGRYLVERDTSQRVAYAARVGRTTWVWIDGQAHTVADDADGGRTVRPASDGPADLSAPMPATVVAVDVQPGQAVARGETLLRLEAMKMEWPLVAPRDGIVKAVRCATGDLVQPGVPLVDLT
jgi:biotin carboxyl carrier protein